MFLNSLNPVQLSAATFGDGPLLILAGAGSGKTKVLVSRVAYLVLKKGVRPEEIVAVTFTNKAAEEMRKRLNELIGDKANKLWLGTFHSIGLRLLRIERNASSANALTVYNDDTQLSLVKQVMSELNINEKAFSPKAIQHRINCAKNENTGPEEYNLNAADFFSEKAGKVYSLYQKRLIEMGCMDFGDLICGPIKLLQNNASLLAKYQSRFSHLLVDEYQDTNKAQYILTQMLSGGTKNLLAVGDPDQSIYGWRGARIDNILNFEEDYPDATIIRLEQNYRSTKHILSAANSVIRKNLQRMEKDLWTENSDGMPVVFEESPDEYQEARAVIKKIKSLNAATDGLKYRDIAIFYRTNAQSRVFEEQLIREGMPYAIVGGTRFYDRKEIRDAIAYLMTVANPADAMSFQRVINTPSRHIGKAALDSIVTISAGRGLTLFDALKVASSEGVLQQKAKAREFINAIEIFKGAGAAPADAKEETLFSNSGADNAKPELLSDRTLKLLENSGYMRMLQEEGTEEAFERIENLFELVSAIKDFETSNPDGGLNAFLDHVALISAVDSYEGQTDKLTLMTIHSAKGLEFKAVFIAGMEEGLFPLQGRRSSGDEDELEEERRLCYVGMTRAKESLFLHSARQRTVYGKLNYKERSRFIDEISHEHIEITGQNTALSQAKTFKRPSNEVYYTSEDSQITGVEHDDNPDTNHWKIGLKVKHPTFGVGVIKERSGNGEDIKLTIRFSAAGVKKLAVKYAYLTPVGE